MDIELAIRALSNPTRRRILHWLKLRSNFPPSLPENADVEGVCMIYIQEKAGLSQSTISTYMNLLKQANLIETERRGQWTYCRRNEQAIGAFLDVLGDELSLDGAKTKKRKKRRR